jgi:hypothetical protein
VFHPLSLACSYYELRTLDETGTARTSLDIALDLHVFHPLSLACSYYELRTLDETGTERTSLDIALDLHVFHPLSISVVVTNYAPLAKPEPSVPALTLLLTFMRFTPFR